MPLLQRLTDAVRGLARPGDQRVEQLLVDWRLTAREIQVMTGLPRSELYTILGRLYERKIVFTDLTGLYWVNPLARRPGQSSLGRAA